MNESNDWEEVKKTYLVTLTSDSQIKKTKTLFTHLEDFLSKNNLDFKDLPANLDRFKAYLQDKIPKKSSFAVYWSYFDPFYSWLDTEYLKEAPVSQEAKPHKLEPPAIEPPQVTFDLDKWISERNYTCPDCRSQPFKDKDGLWYVVCSKPKQWREGKYGGRFPGDTRGKGKIHIEVCQSTQAYLIKRKLETTKDKDFKEVTNEPDQPDMETIIAELKAENRQLRQRIEQLEPYESLRFIHKQREGQRNYIKRLLASDKPFKCWKDRSSSMTLEKCVKFCGNYKDCKDRLNHEPLIIALTYMEKELRNRQYCPLKDQIVHEHDCLFKCQDQDREKCQKLREDPTFLKERIEKIIDLYLSAIQPLEPSLENLIQDTIIPLEREITKYNPETKPEPEPDSDSPKELPENITWIDPKTGTMTLEDIEREFGLSESDSEDEKTLQSKESISETTIEEIEKPYNLDGNLQRETPEPPTIKEPSNESLSKPENPQEPTPKLIVHQVKCPRDKAPKLQRECLSCKVWQRNLCTEYQKFPQTEQDLAFKTKASDELRLKGGDGNE